MLIAPEEMLRVRTEAYAGYAMADVTVLSLFSNILMLTDMGVQLRSPPNTYGHNAEVFVRYSSSGDKKPLLDVYDSRWKAFFREDKQRNVKCSKKMLDMLSMITGMINDHSNSIATNIQCRVSQKRR